MYGGMTKTSISLNQDHIEDIDYICVVRMRVASQVMTDGSTGDGVAICWETHRNPLLGNLDKIKADFMVADVWTMQVNYVQNSIDEQQKNWVNESKWYKKMSSLLVPSNRHTWPSSDNRAVDEIPMARARNKDFTRHWSFEGICPFLDIC